MYNFAFMPTPFAIPDTLVPPASNAQLLYNANRFEETVAFCQMELALLEKLIPAKSGALPQEDQPSSAPFQYFGLTSILVNALAELERWKAAKEVLGRYRVHFPHDPWGFAIGAEITRRDPQVNDRAAVQRAVELLEVEGKRLEVKAQSKHKK
jgi:hypothetical protein